MTRYPNKTGVTTLQLPYPPSELNPNARQFWAKKARALKHYKAECLKYLSNQPLDGRGIIGPWSKVDRNLIVGCTKFSIEFCPPNNNRRDLDNAIASFKAGFDAISVAVGVDDSKFTFDFSIGPKVDGGAVFVTFMNHTINQVAA